MVLEAISVKMQVPARPVEIGAKPRYAAPSGCLTTAAALLLLLLPAASQTEGGSADCKVSLPHAFLLLILSSPHQHPASSYTFCLLIHLQQYAMGHLAQTECLCYSLNYCTHHMELHKKPKTPLNLCKKKKKIVV